MGFVPPEKAHPLWGTEFVGYGRVDVPVLALQWLVLGAITVALVVALGRRRPEPTD